METRPLERKHLKNMDGSDGCGNDLTAFCYGLLIPTPVMKPNPLRPGHVEMTIVPQTFVMQPLRCPYCGQALFWEGKQSIQIAKNVPVAS